MGSSRRLATPLLAALAAVVVVGCHGGEVPQLSGQASSTPSAEKSTDLVGTISSVPLTPPRGGSGPMLEQLSTEQTGISFVNQFDLDHPLRYLYNSGHGCGGIAIGDVDGDGLPDIYFLGGPGPNKLYRQIGDFRFEDITEQAGLDGVDTWSAGAAMVDIDGDGDLDIYACNYVAPNLLYINRGDGIFTEQAKAYGVDFVDASLMPAFCDYDRDGDLDFYLLTNRYEDPNGLPEPSPLQIKDGRPYLPPELETYYTIVIKGNRIIREALGRQDYLLRNNGDGTFTDVTRQAGMGGRRGDGLSATWWDFNRDGLPDLYVANDFNTPDYLFENNGDGTFTEVIEQHIPHTTWFSMGADVADINNDGLLDFYVADMSATTHFMEKTSMGAMNAEKLALVAGPPPQIMRNALYLNTGTDRFMEAACLAGLADSNWTWSIKFPDLDNDGRVDVFVTNGVARNTTHSDHSVPLPQLVHKHMFDFYVDLPPRTEQNLTLRNLGDLQFEDVSHEWGADHVGMSYAAAYADFDRDGDLDMVVANLGEEVSVYRNTSTTGHRVLVRLRGTVGDTQGIGATVRIHTAAGEQVRQLKTSSGFMGSDESLVHFGLGPHETIERMTIQWISSHVQTFENLEADRFYTITEPAGPAPQPKKPRRRRTLFARSKTLQSVTHRETPYDDFARQPLLPNKLSQLGPGMAWGDVDGDGDDDLYFGGAASRAGALYINEGKGKFVWSKGLLQPFRDDRASEDMAPLLFDADGDGDLDLYVTSGGVECEPGDEVLRDRLYLNNGKGIFRKAPAGSLPDLRDSGSVAAACDFDRDGDLDLFVGSRVIPGSYPLSPDSRLLRNEGGKFTDVTDQLAPSLKQTGLVTGAVWSDADGDGWLDLLVTHEWGPVKLYRNHEGRLVDETQPAGLADRLGWWNSIAARDLDADGDVDYVVTNFGLNTKYHASKEKPTVIYYGDFDQSGTMRLVESEFEDDTLYPIRGRSCSTRAMPFLADRFTSFHDFALADLQTIYTPERLADAHKFEVNTLESGLLINDGKGRFEFRPLPRLAQASPGFGVVLTDVDADGITDLYLAQNFYGPQPETGRMDGGLSLLLLGVGDGRFTPVWPSASGLVVPEDAKSLTTTDLNGDGWPDFVVGINDGDLITFQNRGSRGARPFTVRLEGPTGNPTAVGARVTVHLTDGPSQTAEVHAGSGYLSQSSAALVFGLGEKGQVQEIVVRWPNGQTSSTEPPVDARAITLGNPAL